MIRILYKGKSRNLISALVMTTVISGVVLLLPTQVRGENDVPSAFDQIRYGAGTAIAWLFDSDVREHASQEGLTGAIYDTMQQTGPLPTTTETLAGLGGGVADLLGQPIIKTIQVIIYLVIYILGFIVAFGVALLDLVLSISKFSTNTIVETGWVFTRDALNFVFILAILIIAFAEIAGLSGWNIRALLPRLLIAALLVNFSLVISGALIDFSRVLMSGLTGDATDVGSALVTGENGILRATAVSKYFSVRPDRLWSSFFGVDHNVVWFGWMDLVGLIISFLGILLATATMFVSALFLLVRAIGLWILLILSPVGFVFTILPQTKPWAEKWWGAFIKYVMYGPVFVFFLALSGKVGSALNDRGSLFEELFLSGTEPRGSGIEFLFNNDLIFFVFQSMFFAIFIFGGLIATQQMGIYGGSKAAGMVTGLTGLGLKGIREGTGAGYIGRRVKEGWEAESAERRKEAEIRQRTGKIAQFGSLARAPFSSKTQERTMQRSIAERAKQMDENNIEGRSAVDAMKDPGKTMVERKASALHAVKQDSLDKPDDYQTALELLQGTKEHTEVQRNYRRAHPMLERTGAKNIGEVTAKLQAMPAEKKASVIKDVQDDVRKAKSDQARDWSGDTIRVMVENKIHPGSSNIRTIMREGGQDARNALQENKGAMEKHERTMLAAESGNDEQTTQSQSQGSGI